MGNLLYSTIIYFLFCWRGTAIHLFSILTMKQFARSFIIFIMPVLLLGICCEILLRKIPNDYSFKSNHLNIHSDTIETLILGSSHAFYGINPEYITSKSFNAANISQSLNYDWEILKKYDGKWGNLKCIVVPVDYFSLFSRLETGVESWRVKNYIIYFGMHTSNKIADHTELFSNKLSINLSRLYSYYFHKKSNITCSDLGWGTNYNSSNKKDLTETGKSAAKRHTKKDEKYYTENLNILTSIIEFAKKRNIKILLVTFPAYHTYTENLNHYQLNRTINTIYQLNKTYSNISYYNLLYDTTYTETDFYDADHLNEIGAKKFTKALDSLINILPKALKQ